MQGLAGAVQRRQPGEGECFPCAWGLAATCMSGLDEVFGSPLSAGLADAWPQDGWCYGLFPPVWGLASSL